MFSKPNAGWTTWEINGHRIGNVSHLDDVPYIFVNKCCDYLKNPVGFNLVFDGEGNNHGLSLMGSYFCSYSFHGSEPPYLTEITPVSDMILLDTEDGPEFVAGLLREAIPDFERNFGEWSRWNPGEYESEDDVNEEAENLRNLIRYGKEVLARKPWHEPELGNLLWGNSQGNYPVNREPVQEIFFGVFDGIFDGYGHLEDDEFAAGKTDRGGYENETFSINPYYWGDDDDIKALPNFVYKPEGIEISWYKYPFRDSYSNVPLNVDKAREIFVVCRNSMQEQK